jgi:hypothetical protein
MSTTTFTLTPAELALCENLPEDNLIELAAELNLLIPERISRSELLASAITRIAELARQEGLPFSRYDRDDLEALPGEHLRALALLCGSRPTVDGLLKGGQKVYKTYTRQRPQSPVAMMLPMLLTPLARYAAEHAQS